MRITEILFEADDEEKKEPLIEQFEKFVKKNAKYLPDRETIMTLIDHPLYRAMRQIGDLPFFVTEFPKSRKPTDNPKRIQELLDNYFARRGFETKREKSIFTVGSPEYARGYLKEGRDVFVIIPGRGFNFIWNKLLNEFYIDELLDKDLFRIDVDKLFGDKNIFEEFTEMSGAKKAFDYMLDVVYINCPDRFNEIIEILDEKNIFREEVPDIVYEVLRDCVRPTREALEPYNKAVYYMLKYGDRPEVLDTIHLNEDSELLEAYTDKDLEQAARSGHEVTVSGDKYFAIREDFFDKYREEIRRILNKYARG